MNHLNLGYLKYLAVVISLLMGLPSTWSQEDSSAKRKPNIIIVLADDLGWKDVGCYGSKFYETPHIDRLAKEGMKFTDGYSASPVCSPSRAAILTGRYPAKIHLTDWIPGYPSLPQHKLKGPDSLLQLPVGIPNLAQVLKSAGYVTASIGKWHLGEEEKYWPEKQGFDVNIGGWSKGQPASYFSPYKNPRLTDGPKGEFLSDRLTVEANKFIEQHKDEPFFIYLSHYAVHTPLMAKPEVVEKYKAKVDPKYPQKNPTYAGLVESLDDSIGSLLNKLEELKLSENTIVIFTSDNGGLNSATSNLPLREGKATAYEGGVRVPLIIRWPSMIKSDSLCHVPVMGIDFFPTLCEIAGLADNENIDGESIFPLLRESGTLERKNIYWHYPYYHPAGSKPHGVIREGDYRLVAFYENNKIELYNLKNDIGETKNLATSMPEISASLHKKLLAWLQHVEAKMPTSNPNYDPTMDGKEGHKKKNLRQQ